MRGLRSLLLAVCLAGAGASAADASTVTVTLDARFHDFNEVRYLAAPGEANDLNAHYAADALSVTVTDPGAVITAQGSCMSLSPHSAVCRAPNPPFPIAGQFVQSVRALLGDRNDRAITSRTGPNVIGGIDADGGPGNDVLIGSPTIDHLDGGGGTDVLRGGGGNDTLTDGDRDGAGTGLGPDADSLDGGPGPDTLSYAQRTRGVVVDLEKKHAGEPGERDAVRSFEDVVGGQGNDRLSARRTRRGSLLDGRGGANVLVGRSGPDILRHATGRRVFCGGSANDWLTRPRAHTLIPRSCERLQIRATRGAILDNDAIVGPTPRRRAGALGFEVTCPSLDGEPEDCDARVRIRSHGRLLARGRLDDHRADERFMRLHLTALGRRLHADDRRQRAVTTMRGSLMRATAWTIAF